MTVSTTTRRRLAATVLLLVAGLLLAACSDGVGLAGDGEAGGGDPTGEERNLDDPGAEPQEVPLAESIPTVPSNGPIETIPQGEIQVPESRPPQTIPRDNGFGGGPPPSFPNFTFSISGTTVNGSGCTGGEVQLYFTGGGEGGDIVYASPGAGGTFSATVSPPPGATALSGNCIAVGTSGQTHIGGSHTVPLG